NPVPGQIDLLVSSELLETVRQIGLGMASAGRTTVLTSSARALTVAEKMQLGDGRVDDAALIATLQRHCTAAEVIDMTALARDAITRETARWLALWMAFDDIVRVAHLKLRTSRSDRVRREVAARDDEIVKVFDHFKPGVPELAALLPGALAERLSRWDARRRA